MRTNSPLPRRRRHTLSIVLVTVGATALVVGAVMLTMRLVKALRSTSTRRLRQLAKEEQEAVARMESEGGSVGMSGSLER
jgi:hypothetical protein